MFEADCRSQPPPLLPNSDDDFASAHFAALVLSELKFLRIGFSIAAIPAAIFSEPPAF
jgi:hypothetical protein